MDVNVGSFLHRWAQQDPKRTGIVDTGRDALALSYGELDRQASRVAAHLRGGLPTVRRGGGKQKQ